MRRLDRPQEDDELQVGDVHAGGEHVHGDDDAGFGPVAELADALQRPVHVGSGDLLHECLAAAEDVAASVDQLVGVRGVRQVVGGEDQRLGEAAVALLVLVGVLLDLFEDLAVGVGDGDLALDLGGVEAAARLPAGRAARLPVSGSTRSTCSPSLRKTPLHADVRFDATDVVVDEIALADRPLVLVAVDDVLEVGHGVRGRAWPSGRS